MLIPEICMWCPIHLGNVFCLLLKELKTLYHIFPISCIQIGVVPFEIKSVFVRDNEHDLQNVLESPKIEHLPFSIKKNQHNQ